MIKITLSYQQIITSYNQKKLQKLIYTNSRLWFNKYSSNIISINLITNHFKGFNHCCGTFYKKFYIMINVITSHLRFGRKVNSINPLLLASKLVLLFALDVWKRAANNGECFKSSQTELTPPAPQFTN